MPPKDKLEYIKKISKVVEDYVNENIKSKIQKGIYHSTEKDLKIIFEQEKICKSALFIKKKKYATHTIMDDGIESDKISVTGLEIIRSDTPVIFKKALKEILEMILKGNSDEEINKITNNYVSMAKNLPVSEISSNIGINHIKKYLTKKGDFCKGTPWHVKGAGNYKKLLNSLNIQNKYEPIQEGIKAKVVYVKKNPYNIDSISYQKWPEEFTDVGVIPDTEKMIEKFFIKKIKYLLSPMGKEDILSNSKKIVNLFFT